MIQGPSDVTILQEPVVFGYGFDGHDGEQNDKNDAISTP
jgi:hypothetical protein